MKIQFKRNTTSANAIPSGTSAGEPIWFKDELYVGSVGSGVGGTTTAGTPVKVVGHPTGLSNNTLTLSTTAATYATINGVDMKIALPASDPYTSARTPASHTHGDIDNSGNVTTSTAVTVANGDALLIADSSASNKLVKSAITFDGSTTDQYLSKAGTWQNVPASENQKVKAGSEEFSANDVVNFVGGTEIGVVGDSNAKTITISSNITHPATTTGTYRSVTVDAHGHVTAGTNPTTLAGYGITDAKIENNSIILGSASVTPLTAVTAVSATPVASLSGDTLTFKQVSQATSAQMSIADSATTLTFKSAPTSSNKIITETDISGIVGAMVYQGTVGTGGTVTDLPTAAASNKGHVYVVKTAGTYAGKACEIGDMCVSNGSSWDIVSGENQVTDAGATLAFGTTSTLATVDGTDITVTMPGDPNTDEKVTPNAITSGSYPILLTPNASTPTTNGQPNYKANVTIDGSTGKITAGGIIVGSSTGFLKADGSVDNTTYLPADNEHNQKIKNGTTTFGDDAIVNLTATSPLKITATTTSGSEGLAFTHEGPGTGGADITAGTAGTSAGQTPSAGGTFNIPYVTYNAKGHITAAGTSTVTLPSAGTDEKVYQKAFTSQETGNYPILASEWSKTQWGEGAAWTNGENLKSRVWDAIYMNKSGEIHASKFIIGTTEAGSGDIMLSDGSTLANNYYQIAGNYKTVQTAVSDPTADATTSTTFIDSISQDTNGVITATKKTIPAINNNALKVKANYTGASGSTSDSDGGSIFTANASSDATLSITGTNGIKTYRNTSSQAISIEHTNAVSGGAQSNAGLYKVAYDAQGHITSTTAVQASDITGLGIVGTDEKVGLESSAPLSGQYRLLLEPTTAPGKANWIENLSFNINDNDLTLGEASNHVLTNNNYSQYITIPAAANDGKLQLQVGSGSAVDSGFNADSSSDVALKFSATATGATFAVDSSTKEISISAIDGGTF